MKASGDITVVMMSMRSAKPSLFILQIYKIESQAYWECGNLIRGSQREREKELPEIVPLLLGTFFFTE